MTIGVGTPNSTFGFITGATISVDAGSGSDRYLLAFAIGSRQVDGAVTYNGVAMDLIAGTGATGLHGAIYGLANPPTGAHNLDIQVVGNANVLIAGVGLDGVDQVTPHGTGSETTGTGSPLSGSVSDSATGDVVFAAGFIGHTAGGGTITKDASQTNLVENDAPDGARSMSISYKAGAAGTFTMQCTATQATGGGWVHVMVNIKAAGGGGASTGSAAITEADDTVAAAGTLPISGTASIAEADDTLAATGAMANSGVANITEADDTLAATGTLPITGTAAITEANDTLAATGITASASTGAAAITEQDDTLAATAVVATVDAGPGGGWRASSGWRMGRQDPEAKTERPKPTKQSKDLIKEILTAEADQKARAIQADDEEILLLTLPLVA